MFNVKLRKIGSSLGIIIPKNELDKMNLNEGDQVFGITNKNEMNITPYDPEFEKDMELIEQTSHKFRNALKALSKL